MDTKSKISILPPYPRFGEIYRLLALALDTKSSNKDRGRDLDRLAREGDYDWSLLPNLSEEFIKKPLRKYLDEAFVTTLVRCLDDCHSNYRKLVSTISLDSLSRKESLPLLIENYFALQGAELILLIHEQLGGPDLMRLLDTELNPISVVFSWVDEGGGDALAKAAYPTTVGSDKTDREMLTRWEKHTQLPELTSIKRFLQDLSNKSTKHKDKIPDLFLWLLIGRALAWLERDADPIKIRDIMRRHLLLGIPQIDIGKILSMAVYKAGQRFAPLTMPGLMLSENLKLTSSKVAGDQSKTQTNLVAFEQMTAQHDPDGITHYRLEWMKGRWQVLSGNYKKALPHYQKAAEWSYYRVGDNQKRIIEEAVVLAAYLGDKPFLKQLKHRAIAFGLFSNPNTDKVIEEWEIDQIRRQFPLAFPRQGHFIEALPEDCPVVELPFLEIDWKELHKKPANLRKPDQIFTIRSPDGQTRRWPQLRCFAMLGRVKEVKALLEKGASVDQMDESGGSTILCAIQHAAQKGNREVLDILLQYKHAKETLDRPTDKMQLTPLIVAINDYGEPDVVEQLLRMGATAERRGTVDNATPLHSCLSNIVLLLNPELYNSSFYNYVFNDGDLTVREARRRVSIFPTGVFGEFKNMQALLETPRIREIFGPLASGWVKQKVEGQSIHKLVKIAELLLQYGANPNAPHRYPEPGRTPLMLAAKINSVQIFDTLMQHGGKPYQQDEAGRDCLRIAIGFGSSNIVSYLRARGFK
ncbi:MAG: ankyrin repeat domain-containing protein [Candidatus Methylumidiphilus sp.]